MGYPFFGRVHCPNEEWLARTAPEPALEPDLPIVDTHVHLWHFGECAPYFVPEYARDLEASGHNVEASVFVECHAMYRADGPEHLKCVGETEFAAGMAAMRASGKYTKSRVAAGIDASIFHPQIPDVISLAKAHPAANIVLIHCGSPIGHSAYAGKEAEVHGFWLAGMKELTKCPNVSVKMGGLLINIGNFDFTTAPVPPDSATLASLWRPYIEPCIEIFGAERCMFASNFPVDKAVARYGTIWNVFKRITAGCSDEEKRALYSGTAKRVCRHATFGDQRYRPSPWLVRRARLSLPLSAPDRVG